MILGINAFNISSGGGITHLIEFINNSYPKKNSFEKIYLWSSEKTLKKIPNKDWLIKKSNKLLNSNLIFRVFWHIYFFKKEAMLHNCDIILLPGGINFNNFKPTVTMSRNMLPFEKKEMLRYGFSFKTLKLYILRLVQKKSFKDVNGLIFLTDYAMRRITEQVNIKKLKYKIINHGINKKFFRKPPSHIKKIRSFKLPIKLIYVSTFSPYKHHKNVLFAINQLIIEGYEIKVELIGAPDKEFKTIKRIVSKIDPYNRYINILTDINYDDLPFYYHNADIGVFASTCENLPNILIEKMASGLPIACSNYGPMREILQDGGEYFDPENYENIKEILKKLIISSELRMTLSNKAYKLSKKFSWKKCSQQTLSFLHEIAFDFEKNK